MTKIFVLLLLGAIFAITILSFLLYRLWREHRALLYECEALRVVLFQRQQALLAQKEEESREK